METSLIFYHLHTLLLFRLMPTISSNMAKVLGIKGQKCLIFQKLGKINAGGNRKGGVVVAKDKESKMKKKAKELSQSQMQESSSKNPDDYQVKGSE